jgi:hypothetical protein
MEIFKVLYLLGTVKSARGSHRKNRNAEPFKHFRRRIEMNEKCQWFFRLFGSIRRPCVQGSAIRMSGYTIRCAESVLPFLCRLEYPLPESSRLLYSGLFSIPQTGWGKEFIGGKGPEVRPRIGRLLSGDRTGKRAPAKRGIPKPPPKAVVFSLA